MQKEQTRWLNQVGLILLFSCTTGVVFYHLLGDLLFQLNTTQFDALGDGFKNYFTFAYQYKHGTGTWFDGMLYPYGEHLIYTDGQPLLVWIFQALRSIGINIEGYELLTLRACTMANFVLLSFFTYKIGRYYQLPVGFAILVAVLCVAMSPQLYRVPRHFSLVYGFIFPLVWYLWLRFESKKYYTSLFIMVLLATAIGFLHPYLMLSICLFGLAYALVRLLIPILVKSSSGEAGGWKTHAIRFATALLPIIIFTLITQITDPITDRPQNPHGVLSYKSEIADLFPFYGVLAEKFSEPLQLRTEYREGYCYAGFLFLLMPVLLIIIFLYKYFLRKEKITDVAETLSTPQPPPKGEIFAARKVSFTSISPFGGGWGVDLRPFTITALLILAIATGLHVTLTGGWILELLPPLKQFRALGRLSWGFYYVAFVCLAVWFWRFIEGLQTTWRYGLLAVALVGWSYDVHTYHKHLRMHIQTYKSENLLYTEQNIAQIMQNAQRNTNEFQAMLTLPPSIEGAEIIGFPDDKTIRRHALPYAYQSGLPMTMGIMSRTSTSRALKVCQLGSSKFVQKELLEDLPSNLPFLVVIANDKITQFADILGRAEKLGSDDLLTLYQLDIQAATKVQKVSKVDLKNAIYMSNSEENKAVDIFQPTDILIQTPDTLITSNFIYYNFYENKKTKNALYSEGAFFTEKNKTTLADVPARLTDTLDIEVSMWFKVQSSNNSIPICSFRAYDENGEWLLENTFMDNSFLRVEIVDDWVRFLKSYTLPPNTRRIELELSGKNLWIDNVLIKSKSLDVYAPTSQPNLIYFNHKIVEYEP